MSSRGVLIATDSIDSIDFDGVETFGRSPKTPPIHIDLQHGKFIKFQCKCFTDLNLTKCECKFEGRPLPMTLKYALLNGWNQSQLGCVGAALSQASKSV